MGLASMLGGCSTNLADTRERGLRLKESISSSAELCNLVFCELVCPFFRVGAVFLWVPDRGTGDLLREFLIWHDLVVERLVLACSS